MFRYEHGSEETNLHRSYLFKAQDRAVHAPVIRIIKVMEHFSILLACVDLKQLGSRPERGATIFDKSKEGSKRESTLEMKEDTID